MTYESDKGMVKVLRVITRLNIGGPAIHAILLSSEFNKNGYYRDILVCGKVSESEGDMLYLAKEKELKPVMVPELCRDISFIKDIKAFFSLFAIIRRERPDIIHTHTAKAGTLGRLAAIFAGVPVKIHTFHGHVFDGYFSPRKARAFVFIEKFLGLFTDRIITVSDRVKKDIAGKLGPVNGSKSVVIPLGLELGKFLDCEKKKGILRERFKLPGGSLLVGIVGRLVPIKNHTMFLDAAKKALSARPRADIRFLIIGDGESRASLEEYAAKTGLNERTIFTGWIEDLASVYADLDIVALTSLNEGTPVSLIEALASARPVVSTSVGGVSDLIEDGVSGLLAGSGDLDDFTGKLIELIDNKEMRTALGSSGRDRVKTKYSKERLVRDIKGLYQECLSKR